MTHQTYRMLCEAVQLVTEAAERSSDGELFLDEWRKWARGFLAGLYYAKTARRAAQSAVVEADACGHNPLVGVAKAAALAASGVVHASQKEEDTARAKAAAARDLLADVAIRHGKATLRTALAS